MVGGCKRLKQVCFAEFVMVPKNEGNRKNRSNRFLHTKQLTHTHENDFPFYRRWLHSNMILTSRRRPASLDIDEASAAAKTKSTKPACMDARAARALVLKVGGGVEGGWWWWC